MPSDQPGESSLESLPCAYCSKPIVLDSATLVEGLDVPCPHCREDCVLEREWLGHGEHYRWILVEDGDDEEP